MNILDFEKRKLNQQKISMVTCYDYTSARILSETSVDILLVGDSLAMTLYGFENTLSATLDIMQLHTKAVCRGAKNKFILGDLPFLTYRKSMSENISNAGVLMQAGAHAVKLEGAAGNTDLITRLTQSGIPVMGHLGLTPQSIAMLGGYKLQGKTASAAEVLKREALLLEEAGCFSLVLECVPAALGKEITESLLIPTIGIGAGRFTDGQVLVFQDLLGLNKDFKPKFVKTFLNGFEQIKNSVDHYVDEINSGVFPSDEHSYQS